MRDWRRLDFCNCLQIDPFDFEDEITTLRNDRESEFLMSIDREPFLQDYVVPICAYTEKSGQAVISEYCGTAFFINKVGHFLTAKHVVDVCRADRSRTYGLVVKGPNDASNHMAPLTVLEDAPAPWDVSIGFIAMPTTTWVRWPVGSAVAEWSDVATMGYPESALRVSPAQFDIHLRTLKGYVIRQLTGDDYGPSGGQAPGLELSFVVPQGMSGAPLFLQGSGPTFDLVGVCVSSHETEVCEHVHEEVEESGSIFRERRLRVEQYGIAHRVSALADWEPALLNGLSLREAMT